MDAWLLELREPTPDFMAAYAARVRARGLEHTLRELVERVPQGGPEATASAQGLMGLRAILVLAPWMEEASLHGLLAAHALGLAMGPLPEKGALVPEAESYAALRDKVAPDMACTGIKPILAHQMEDLAGRLGLGSRLLSLTENICKALPTELHWHQRALKRLEGPLPECSGDPVRLLCEGGLMAVLDCFGGLVRRGESVLDPLAEGAARKLLEACKELQGRTSWLFVYLSTLPGAGPAQWLQGAALVHLFPSEEWAPMEPQGAKASPGDLLDAILDGEPRKARRAASGLLAHADPAELMPILAEAVASCDPMNDGGHRLLAAAAVAELLPLLGRSAQAWVLLALANCLAATQTSGDRVGIARRAWVNAR